MNQYISMFIDNELSLDEKILFIESIYDHKVVKDECITLILLEKTLKRQLIHKAPLHVKKLSIETRNR